jgi:hypothetical protein
MVQGRTASSAAPPVVPIREVDWSRSEEILLGLEPYDIPLVHLTGARVRVPAGSCGGARSLPAPPTEVTILDISLV